MKLLIVTQKVDAADSNLGFFVRWIEEFARKCERIAVIANEVHKDAQGYMPDNVALFSLGKEDGASRVEKFRRYRKLLHEQVPVSDRVFFHMCPEYVLVAGWLPRKHSKKTLLWYVHKEVNWKLYIAEKLVDKIFTASKESFRLKSNKVQVVGHGIDTDFFNNGTENAHGLHLVTAGRISPVKDLKTIIGGFLELKKKFGEATLSIIGEPLTEGDCAYRDELIRLFSESVRFKGGMTHKDLPRMYGAATVFLHASKTGSMDKAVLEALASGLTVFTSSEAFSEEIPGVFKFKQGNSEDLAKRICTSFLRGEIVYNEYGREWVKTHHDLRGLIKKIIDSF